MSSTVHIKDKRTGVTYVYESTSYWDKEKKAPRNHRRIIGKLDPDTGAIIPTQRRGRAKRDNAQDTEQGFQKRIEELENRVSMYAIQLGKLQRSLSQLGKLQSEMGDIVTRMMELSK